jgi:UBX domain-containing protein 1/4
MFTDLLTVEAAMNWLEKTQDTPLDELLEEEKEAEIETKALAGGEVAQSIVCNDCGKKFRTQQLAAFHAEKT